MKIFLLKSVLLIASVLFFLNSCKKHNEPPLGGNCRLEKLFVYDDAFSTKYQYNSDGNLIKIIQRFGNDSSFTDIFYNKNKQIIKSVHIFANDLKFADSSRFAYDSKNNLIAKLTYEGGNDYTLNFYAYNDKNQLIKDTDSNGSYIRYEYDLNGNIIKTYSHNYSITGERLDNENISF